MRTFARQAFICLALSLPAPNAHTQESPPEDVLLMRNNTTRSGTLLSVDDRFYRLRIRLIPGQPAASVSIPKTEVTSVQFAVSEAADALTQNAPLDRLPALAEAWQTQRRFLSVAKSPAAQIGLTYADLLLRRKTEGDADKALEICKEIESQAWDSEEKARAKQIKLRGMIATGNAKDAIGEAQLLAKESEDPAVLIEAKFILAKGADAQLRKLEADNPRWQQDIYVRPDRQRLVNESIDLYLFPYLFFGSDIDSASRGLWGAVGIYRFTGETHNALESARDLVALYPSTSYAKQASEFIASLPPEMIQQDNEKDAQQNP